MPVCVNCACPVQHVYTIYRTKSNIRLAVCPRCDAFVDPLIEHPGLILLLDLILLRPRVYLHLLYNRGCLPYDASNRGAEIIETEESSAQISESSRRGVLLQDLVQLGVVSIAAESLLRVIASQQNEGNLGIWDIGGVMSRLVIEAVVQHLVTMALASCVLYFRGWLTLSNKQGSIKDGRQVYFMPLIIPLIQLYTSILPLLLQLLLSIWYTPQPSSTSSSSSTSTSSLTSRLTSSLPHTLLQVIGQTQIKTLQETETAIVEAWQTVDRIWAGTRLLGGMSAGFGLRCVLPTKPWETTIIVLAGWGAAALAGRALA